MCCHGCSARQRIAQHGAFAEQQASGTLIAVLCMQASLVDLVARASRFSRSCCAHPRSTADLPRMIAIETRRVAFAETPRRTDALRVVRVIALVLASLASTSLLVLVMP